MRAHYARSYWRKVALVDAITGAGKHADDLMPAVYDELRRLASRYLRSERPGHTLRPTALVHEAYLRLASAEGPWRDRGAFCAAAAQAMRRILVDYARSRNRQKRGGGGPFISLDEAIGVHEETAPDLLELDEALTRLALQDERKARIVELLFFGGLTYEECAEALGISTATLDRDLRLAKAWLWRELSRKTEAT